MSIKWILFILKLLEIDYKQCIILKESRFSMKESFSSIMNYTTKFVI